MRRSSTSCSGLEGCGTLKVGTSGLFFPEVDRDGRVPAEGDDRLEVRPGDHVVEAVAPLQVVLVGEQRLRLEHASRVHGDREGVDEDVAAREPELVEEALDPLAGVADEGAAHQALGGTGVGGDPEELRVAAQPARGRTPGPSRTRRTRGTPPGCRGPRRNAARAAAGGPLSKLTMTGPPQSRPTCSQLHWVVERCRGLSSAPLSSQGKCE